MPAVTLLVAVIVSVVVGAALAVFLVRRAQDGAAHDRDAAIEAAVSAVLSQAGHTLGLERAETVQAAVDTAVTVANDKLGEKATATTRELDLRTQAFESRVTDVADQLRRLGSLVQDLQKSAADQHGSVVEQMRQVARTQSTLAEHTGQLRAALASPKQRGQWGERMADDVLRAAGLREGLNYRRQTAIDGGTIPDFSFLLPNELEVRMDVKFPIDNYLRVLDAVDDDDARARASKAFVRDVRNRIKELAGREYADVRDTVDCVLLFIPNEAVYAFLHDADPDVLDVVLGQSVVLCSPSTLFAVLAVIRRSVEQFRLERTSDEILRCLGAVTDQWGRFSDQLDTVGKRLATLQNGFEDLQGVRRRQFEKTLDDVTRLRDGRGLPGAGEAEAAARAAGDVRPLPSPPGLAG